MESFITIEQTAMAEFRDRGSKFIALAYPLKSADDFKKIVQVLKKEHLKAAHHCFAYRIGTDGNNFRSSDDGEPSGTAGKQILGQIDSNGLTDILIIVVRYFGGTLLGVPGLINAYKTSSSLVLQLVPFIQKKVFIQCNIDFDYTRLNDVMLILKQHHCIIYKQEARLFYNIIASIPKSDLDKVVGKIKNMVNVEIRLVV